MTEEEATHLKQACADLHQALSVFKEETAQNDRRIEELEGLLMRTLVRNDERERRVAKESHQSRKPPSSDGLKHYLKPKPKKSKPKGGQPEPQGDALHQAEKPDEIITHRPEHGDACRCALGTIAGHLRERRRIHERPALRLRVMEQRVEAMCCPACQQVTAAHVPAGGDAPAHSGPQVQALAVSLSPCQVVPMQRSGDRCGDLFGCPLSEGTLATWRQDAARTLDPSMHRLKALLRRRRVDPVDETGARINGVLHGVHVSATPW